MNTAQTTDKKLSMTSGALSHIHSIKTSARNFCKSKKHTGEGYSDAMKRDSHNLFKFIMKKVSKYMGETPETVEYYRDFWYTEGTNQGTYMETPSHRSECGADNIYQWFERNQVYLSSVREKTPKVKVVDVVVPPTVESESDSDLEFDPDNF